MHKWDCMNDYELWQALEVQEGWMWQYLKGWKGQPMRVEAEFLSYCHLWTQS